MLAINKVLLAVTAGLAGTCIGTSHAQTKIEAKPSASAIKLLAAIKKEDAAQVHALMAAGADANSCDADGITAPDFAAAAGSLEICAELIQRGARVNPSKPDEVPPLLFTIDGAQPSVTALLLEKGADPNKADGFGKTAL